MIGAVRPVLPRFGTVRGFVWLARRQGNKRCEVSRYALSHCRSMSPEALGAEGD